MTDKSKSGEEHTDGKPDVVSEMDKVASVIATARRMLDEGKMIDLSALSGKVEAMCALGIGAPPEQREAVARALEELVGALDALAQDLKTQFQIIEDDETESAARQKALSAYGQSKPKK
ncbi:MAG: hypothetical protein HN403_14805 [Rhodospirillales bacterium]|jgi:hypothetical protein|nr:hypothetical protein [Rhodospirillales bacterium]